MPTFTILWIQFELYTYYSNLIVLLVWVMLSRCTRKGTIHRAYVTNHTFKEALKLMEQELNDKNKQKDQAIFQVGDYRLKLD
jgi:hypothetical protein